MIGIRKLLSVEKALPIQAVIDANVVPKMIKFMSETAYPRLQMEAAWALTNIASGTSAQCQSIIDKGGIPLLVKLLSSPYDDVIEQAVWALGNIAGDVPFNRDLIINAGGVDPLIHLAMNSTNLTIMKQSTWALSNLCRGNNLIYFRKSYA
jgi:importin subunit alpha-1